MRDAHPGVRDDVRMVALFSAVRRVTCIRAPSLSVLKLKLPMTYEVGPPPPLTHPPVRVGEDDQPPATRAGDGSAFFLWFPTNVNADPVETVS